MVAMYDNSCWRIFLSSELTYMCLSNEFRSGAKLSRAANLDGSNPQFILSSSSSFFALRKCMCKEPLNHSLPLIISVCW